MNRFRRFEISAAIILIILLVILSIVGAFYGPQKAAAIFNSLPLVIYWLMLTTLLLAGLVTFRRLIQRPALLLIHLGCVLVLAGGMWGSAAGHRLQKKIFGIDKVPSGFMMIYENTAENRIVSEDNQSLAQLPFGIYLKDFRIEYYPEEPYLQIETPEGRKLKMPVETGRELVLEDGKGTIKIVRVFKNFKIKIENGQKTVTDVPCPDSNPAVELQIEEAGGVKRNQYVFERFAMPSFAEGGLKFKYFSQPKGAVRDYYSDLVVLENRKQVAGRLLEVNHPLHYGGYHFYQHSYDTQQERYTILSVVSDSGLNFVYAGFLCLSLAVFWHFWLRHIGAYIKESISGN